MAENIKQVHTLVIGSGAAGLTAALRLDTGGVAPLAVYTEGLKMGTSINTGSDKQTYYKLGMYGAEPDSIGLLARDLVSGGSVHGDIALVEAALSAQAFGFLASLGVPFPHDEYGQYIGYKTDHDPRRRATSCGPYTSREMCRSLISEVKRRGIPVFERRVAVSLLTVDESGGRRCCGAVFVNLDAAAGDMFEAVLAENVVFAVGGPGGLYAQSVYPAVHTGAVGLALEIGAAARNLAESQFGLASVKFRWNVSGSYMQVLPRFVSTAADGVSERREFLREYFRSAAEMYDSIFLKGYQWPFAAGHVPGSSLIDIFVDREITERGRRVFLDYRSDPEYLDFSALAAETRDYLQRSGALAAAPLERLELLNAPAVELYRAHGIDLAAEPLEIAVCAQHNNGGLAGNIWWESENIRRLFPVGEVNGSHGVTRPGGSALNAGQVGAFRAAEYIRARGAGTTLDTGAAVAVAKKKLEALGAGFSRPRTPDWRKERREFQLRMSGCGSFLRDEARIRTALAAARRQFSAVAAPGFSGAGAAEVAEILRNRQLLLAQIVYLEAMLDTVTAKVGSRGGALVRDPAGVPVHPALAWRMLPEDRAFRERVQCCRYDDGTGETAIVWEPCRPVPDPDGWFENVWRDFRTGKIYGGGR